MPPRRLNPFLEDLSRKLLWLLAFRAAVALLILAGSAVVLMRADPPATPVPRIPFGVSGALLLVTALSIAAMARVRDWVRFAYVQLVADVLLWIAVVWGTGGPSSYFVYLLDLVVLLAAVFLGVRGAVALGIAAFVLCRHGRRAAG